MTNKIQTNQTDYEISIRPKQLDDYIGQTHLKENMKVFINASKIRGEVLDHVLLYGPPGLGKTTMANIIANELGVNIKTASGPSIEKSGDLAVILSSLEPGDVLFIDEIHRMPKYIEEILYPAMEDFTLNIIIGSENKTRNIKIDLPPFTLVGATTRPGDLSSPLRDRFGIINKLSYYNEEELTQIAIRTAKVLGLQIDKKSAQNIAKRSRGTPRIVNNLVKRVRDFTLVEGKNAIDIDTTNKALDKLKIDKIGLDEIDKELLLTIIEKFAGGPVGIETLATTLGEDITTIIDMYEPYLIKIGFIKRTQRGRIATEEAYKYLNKTNYK